MKISSKQKKQNDEIVEKSKSHTERIKENLKILLYMCVDEKIFETDFLRDTRVTENKKSQFF